VTPGATVHEDGDITCQDDEEIDYRHALLADHFSLVEVSQGPVSGQPLKLVPRRPADGPVRGKAVDEIGCGHVMTLSQNWVWKP